MKIKQLENLVSFYIVMYSVATSSDLRYNSMSPDYLLEKFSKYIGDKVKLKDIDYSDLDEKRYNDYTTLWKQPNDPMVKQVYTAVSNQGGAGVSPEGMFGWFDTYFDNHTLISPDRYNNMNHVLKTQLYDKLFEAKPYQRYIKLTELGV